MSVLETIRAQLALARRVVEGLERAVQEAAHKGETQAAPGLAGGAPSPTTTAAGRTPTRRRAAEKAGEAGSSRRPVADRKGGLPAPRSRGENGGGRTCTKCGATKPPSEFYPEKRSASGLTARCRECVKAGIRSARRALASRSQSRLATVVCKTCGASVNGAKASQHAWDEHGQRVVRELLGKSFDGVPAAKPEMW